MYMQVTITEAKSISDNTVLWQLDLCIWGSNLGKTRFLDLKKFQVFCEVLIFGQIRKRFIEIVFLERNWNSVTNFFFDGETDLQRVPTIWKHEGRFRFLQRQTLNRLESNKLLSSLNFLELRETNVSSQKMHPTKFSKLPNCHKKRAERENPPLISC